MSQTPDPTNVVNLGERQPSEERVGELLSAVRNTTLARARALAGTLFENVDDALFDLAEKAENNAIQTQYFDGMREVRKKRQLIERKFLDHINREFSRFSGAKGAHAHAANAGNSEGELSLVDDRELEESLAITSMTSKAENRYARALYTVNQRLSVICGGTKIDHTSNPLAPASLAQCFRLAVRELDVDVKVKLIIYKLFERYVLSSLDPLYDAVNVELIRAGVLPQLRHTIKRRPQSAAARGAGGAADNAVDGVDVADDDEAHYGEELFESVNALLATRRQRGNRGGNRRTLPALSVTDLLAALSLLQDQAPQTDDREQFDQGLSLEQLKASLQTQLHKLGRADKAHVSGADEDTIDLVGMLFEYILQDHTLPAQMQVLLGRLQIPYLKVAILDKHLFAQAAHPARQLLDAMADAAKGWSKESDRDLRLYNEAKNVVESLLHSFDDDTAIFERLLARFQQFVDSNSQRAGLAEQRTAESARGREKLQNARRTAAREILSRTDGMELPGLIHNVLTRPWANYLVLTLLRQGKDSGQWRDALRFVDDMAWSAQPRSSTADRKRLRDMLPQLEKHLRHGLDTVAFHETDVKRLMRALGQFYRQQLGEAEPEATAAAGNPEAASHAAAAADEDTTPVIPVTMEPITTAVDVLDEVPPGEALPDDAPAMQQASALRVGNWVEFVRDDSGKDRAKLSWISPISAKYLFVNRRGLKVCDMTLPQLAASVENKRTVILEEVPLFDRALDAIVERLKQDQPATPSADEGNADSNTETSAKATLDIDPAGTPKTPPAADASAATPTVQPPQKPAT